MEGSDRALHLESTLQDLPLYQFQVELDCLGQDLAQLFDCYPLLPGAILVDTERFVGMISRQRFLEFLIRPFGLDLFLQQPLRVLNSYAQSDLLLLPGHTPILAAAQQALRRSPKAISEPILVQTDTYYLLDIHSLNIAHWQIRGIETQVRYERTQAKMIQNNKMASLGRLVDGVAHEILDPVSFIWGNLTHVTTYSETLLKLNAAYEKLISHPSEEILELQEQLESDYLQEDLPKTIASIRTGAERLSKLATSLQNFCHIDDVYPKPVDLHELVDGILLLLKSHLTSEIQVIKNYGTLPPVLCYTGHLNQVFMNILSNTVDILLSDAVSQQVNLQVSESQRMTIAPFKPTIIITTQVCSIPNEHGDSSRWISVCIADNGPGLSVEAQQELLDSFSVKKRATKETSLAMSYQIVTAKHGGKFQVRSRHDLDQAKVNTTLKTSPKTSDKTIPFANEIGTEFEILLPLW
jgi:signal transduction histidine kinase